MASLPIPGKDGHHIDFGRFPSCTFVSSVVQVLSITTNDMKVHEEISLHLEPTGTHYGICGFGTPPAG